MINNRNIIYIQCGGFLMIDVSVNEDSLEVAFVVTEQQREDERLILLNRNYRPPYKGVVEHAERHSATPFFCLGRKNDRKP